MRVVKTPTSSSLVLFGKSLPLAPLLKHPLLSFLLLEMNLPFLEFYIMGIREYALSFAWLFSPVMMHLRVIHAIAISSF